MIHMKCQALFSKIKKKKIQSVIWCICDKHFKGITEFISLLGMSEFISLCGMSAVLSLWEMLEFISLWKMMEIMAQLFKTLLA